MSEGLCEARKGGLLHFDISPDRILVDHGGHARIAIGFSPNVEHDTTITDTQTTPIPARQTVAARDERSDIRVIGSLLRDMGGGDQFADIISRATSDRPDERHATLEELAVDDFEVCMLVPGQPYAPQMRKYGVKHALKLPTLQMDGREIAESGLISQVLAEKYGALLGAPDERLEMMEWVAFAETCITFRIPLLPTLMNSEKTLAELQADAIEPMRAVFKDNIARFEDHFETRGCNYLLDSGFSIADTMCGWSLHTFHGWGIMDLDTADSPKTLAYLERLRARPAFAAAEQYAKAGPGLYRRGGVALTDG